MESKPGNVDVVGSTYARTLSWTNATRETYYEFWYLENASTPEWIYACYWCGGGRGYYTSKGTTGICGEGGGGFANNGVKKGSVSMLHVTSTSGFGSLGLLSRGSTWLLGPPRVLLGSSDGGGCVGDPYPSNGFLPGLSVSTPTATFQSDGMSA